MKVLFDIAAPVDQASPQPNLWNIIDKIYV